MLRRTLNLVVAATVILGVGVLTPKAALAAPGHTAVVAATPAPNCVQVTQKRVTGGLEVKYTAENHCQFYTVRVKFVFRYAVDSSCRSIPYGDSSSYTAPIGRWFDGLVNC